MPVDTRDLILRAAIEVISERGLARATTKAIAEHAGCAEGSIYRYFPDKHALLGECVRNRFPEFLAFVTALPENAGAGTVRRSLEQVAREALMFYRVILPMVGGVFADPHLLEEQRRHFDTSKTGPMKLIASLAEYVRREQRLHRLSQRVVPEVAARLLLGVCFSQAYLEAMIGKEASLGTDERFAREAVRGILEGIEPREDGR